MGNKDKKTILVFGGAGFIGAHFVRFWREHHSEWRVIVLDALTYSGDLARLGEFIDPKTRTAKDPRVEFVHIDIRDGKAVAGAFAVWKPDYVINFAAETHVDRSIHVGAQEFIDTNVTGVFHILEAVKKYGCEKFVQVSTDEVYGELPLDRPDLKFGEEWQYKPNVPYSATKAAGDLLCRAYHFTWQVPVIVTHCSNNYGEWQYPEKLIPFMTHRLLERKTVPIYGDGENVRDWIYVGDHVRALDLVLVQGKSGETYNIGADNERNNLEIAELVIRHLEPTDAEWRSRIEFVTDRPGHDRRYAINASKIERELRWKPVWTAKKFTEKLFATVDWYREHLDWCRAVQARTGVVNSHIDLWKATMTNDPPDLSAERGPASGEKS